MSPGRYRSLHGTTRLRRSIAVGAVVLLAAVPVGCYFGDLSPTAPGIALTKTRLAGSYRLSLLAGDALRTAATAKLAGRALMIDGSSFLTFDLLGDLKYLGTLGAAGEVGLWEIDLARGIAAVGLSIGLPETGAVTVAGVRASVEERPDGTVTAIMGWTQVQSSGADSRAIQIVLDQMRLGPVAGQLTANMTVVTDSSADPAPAELHQIGEVLLEEVDIETKELLGDISPAGRITVATGPPPPYNDNVTFGTGQFFSLDAGDTTAPAATNLTYRWHVVRELTDEATGAVIERERVRVSAGETSGFIAASPGRYYVTLYVTDGVLWRSTSWLGETSAQTRWVLVQ